MKCADILLSVLLHAGLVAGVMYGLSQDLVNDTGEIPIEPIFFEILEESIIDSHSAKEISEGAVPTVFSTETATTPIDNEGPVPTFEGAVPMFVAMPMATPVAEPPFIELGSNPVEKEEPVFLPLPSKLPNESAEADFSENEGPVPSTSTVQQEQSRVVSEPRALNRIVPVYPRSARRRGREGTVTLEILVSDSGEVSDAAVVGGSGHDDLDSAAVSAVRTARFAPATEDGVKVHGRLRLTFEFKLK